ncbi:MAG: glycoside hydrolase family 95 protein, partial [Christiangramia sp.]|nr:glycoside hydrolase family 95 protein [Christiangramia sp.]
PVEIKVISEIGGNLRLRSYYPLSSDGLKKASGDNPNPLFELPDTKKPIISSEASLDTPDLKPVFEYDLATEAGKEYIIKPANND